MNLTDSSVNRKRADYNNQEQFSVLDSTLDAEEVLKTQQSGVLSVDAATNDTRGHYKLNEKIVSNMAQGKQKMSA